MLNGLHGFPIVLHPCGNFFRHFALVLNRLLLRLVNTNLLIKQAPPGNPARNMISAEHQNTPRLAIVVLPSTGSKSGVGRCDLNCSGQSRNQSNASR